MAQEETQVQTRSRKKLEKKIEEETNQIIGSVLAIFESIVDEENRLNRIKSQVKRAINNARRGLEKELERHYLVEYVSTVDDIIVVNGSSKPK